MLTKIFGNLSRQQAAMNVLAQLLEEEFGLLQKGNPRVVAGLQMSIQELIRQLGAERMDLKATVRSVAPGFERLDEFADALPEPDGEIVHQYIQAIDDLEQTCARLSAKNGELARALRDQSVKLMNFLHRKVNPDNTELYTARGQHPQSRPGAAIVRGAF